MLDTVEINHVQHISFAQSRLTDAVSVILSELLSYEHPSKREGFVRRAAAGRPLPKKQKQGKTARDRANPERQHKTERQTRPPESKIRCCACFRSDIAHTLGSLSLSFVLMRRGKTLRQRWLYCSRFPLTCKDASCR